jgi:hypothetical protein
MKKLIKTIRGQSCEVYAISRYNRVPIGKATPTVEICENIIETPTVGTNSIRYKRIYFSVAICPNPKMNRGITEEILQETTSFELSMLLPRKDGVYVPFTLYGITSADLSPEQWVFEVTDYETVKELLTL